MYGCMFIVVLVKNENMKSDEGILSLPNSTIAAFWKTFKGYDFSIRCFLLDK